MVESVKWVDEVLKDVPYDVSESFMQTLFDVRGSPHAAPTASRAAAHAVPRLRAQKHNIDYVIHGDDPCLLPVRGGGSCASNVIAKRGN